MHSSAGSSKSTRAKTRQYRTVSHKSQVDESLFGQPTKAKAPSRPTSNTANEDIFSTNFQSQQQRKSGTKKPKKETVQVITKDLIRNLMYVFIYSVLYEHKIEVLYFKKC